MEVYLLGIEQETPAPLEALRASFSTDEVEFTPDADGQG